MSEPRDLSAPTRGPRYAVGDQAQELVEGVVTITAIRWQRGFRAGMWMYRCLECDDELFECNLSPVVARQLALFEEAGG
jgi:hypothetical protein